MQHGAKPKHKQKKPIKTKVIDTTTGTEPQVTESSLNATLQKPPKEKVSIKVCLKKFKTKLEKRP